MLVSRIFPKVKYPNDRKSIEHIIKEYDKKLDHILGLQNSKKAGTYLVYATCILMIIYMLKCSRVSFFIRLLYMIPLATYTIYNIELFKKVKKDKYENEKLHYKLKNSNVIFICIFIYSGTFMFETALFSEKWTDENYLICFSILAMLVLLSFIIARMVAPKKYIENFQYKESKLYTPSLILTGIVSLLVSIAYFNKPYYLILALSYILLIIMSGLITYTTFIYEQYEKIQELKKEINYRSSNKRK